MRYKRWKWSHGCRSRQQSSCFLLQSAVRSLRVLRSHGLPDQSVKDVFRATVIGQFMYCAPAWHGKSNLDGVDMQR